MALLLLEGVVSSCVKWLASSKLPLISVPRRRIFKNSERRAGWWCPEGCQDWTRFLALGRLKVCNDHLIYFKYIPLLASIILAKESGLKWTTMMSKFQGNLEFPCGWENMETTHTTLVCALWDFKESWWCALHELLVHHRIFFQFLPCLAGHLVSKDSKLTPKSTSISTRALT